MPKVLILDEGSRPAIEVVRSLGRRGIDIIMVTKNKKKTIASMSKYVSKKLSIASFDEQSSFLEEIIEYLSNNTCDMVLPIGETTTEIVSKNKKVIAQYAKVPVPQYSTWIKATDKALTLKSAIDIGIPCPLTLFDEIVDINEVKEYIQFPLVIKPRRGFGSKGICYVRSAEKFFYEYDKVKEMFGIPLVQEFIPPGGSGYGVSVLLNNGDLKALFSHRRLREYPVSGGPSTFRESINSPIIEDYAVKLLKSFGWHGVAMVEFKEDPRDGSFKLMEINPRFWGSLALAILAGVDFPFLLYKMIMTGDVKPTTNYRLGVKSRWLIGDLLWLLSSSNKIKATHEFFKYDSTSHFDLLSFDDPGPILGEIITDIRYINRNFDVFKKGIKIR